MRINRFQWITTVFLAGVMCTVSFAGAQKPVSADVTLEAAAKKEMVDGDLRGAIDLYRKIIAQYGATDRAAVAKALVRMGQCYEKLGDLEAGEARKAYEQVLRDYPDQKEAVSVARARLGSKESAQRAGAMSSRQVWTPKGTIHGNVSHDGRYLPYTNWDVNGELFLHDFATGADRQVTKEVEKFGQEYAQEVTFSPDDTQLAYTWFNKERFEIRIIGLQAPGAGRPRVLFSNPEVPRISPLDWSPDGKWLAVRLQRRDKTMQSGLVAVQDGSLRVLDSAGDSSTLFFSPDGKYLASGIRRDIFILSIDGSREVPAVMHPGNDVLVGWSPDGRHLLFTSDRTGSTGLWALAFGEGKPQGTPEQINVDFPGISMGLTSKGALYSLVRPSNFTAVVRSDIQVAAFDFAKGQFLSKPALAVQAFVGANNFPAWSPDGKQLAFISARSPADSVRDSVIMVLSHDTGQLRELRSALKSLMGFGYGLGWSPDGLSLAILATDAQGRGGIFRIDATTGEATPIAFSSRGPLGEGESLSEPMWAPDGKRIYYCRIGAGKYTAITEHDLSSGNEKEIIRRSGRVSFWALSPDGKHLAVVEGAFFAGAPGQPGKTGKWTVLLVPAGGGEPRDLMLAESQGAGVLMWAPDSRSIFVYSIKEKSTGEREVWRVAIDGTEPQKLDLNVNFLGPLYNSDPQLHPHPDGKRVAFAAAEPAKPAEVWVLENFLPALNKRK